MKDLLKEVVAHTNGIFEKVKYIVEEVDRVKIAKIEAIDDEKSVILKSQIATVLDGMNDDFGFQKISLLNTYLSNATFNNEKSTINLIKKNNEPFEIQFKGLDETEAKYRVINKKNNPNVPNYKGGEWELTIQPKESKLEEFFSLLSDEKNFQVDMDQNNLVFRTVGTSSDFDTKVVIERNLTTQFVGKLKWPVARFRQLTKMGIGKDSFSLSFTSRGAMQISWKTAMGTWNYILPATQ